MQGRLAFVILAAGSGTRMNSSTPKVLHKIFGRPMIQYVLESAKRLDPDRIVVVVGRESDAVKEAVGPPKKSRVSFAVQERQRGTAHALLSAKGRLAGFRGTIIVMCGDTPLVRAGTLKRLIGLHDKHKNSLSVISFIARDPHSYGRIVRDGAGRPVGVIEERDAAGRQSDLREANSGIYAIRHDALPLVSSIPLNRRKKEYYLTDLVGIAVKKGLSVGVYRLGEESELLGVNTREDLSMARESVGKDVIRHWLGRGVNFIDTRSVSIAPSVKIGRETLIYPNVVIEGETTVGRMCTIYPNVRIVDSAIKDRTVIKDSTLVEGSAIGPSAEIGPFAHIRPGSRIKAAKIGNFVEVKKSAIADGSKAMHLSYIGDATVGRRVNVGAGTITCNYDGRAKHKTRIGDEVFIGSDSQLVAPVKLGRGSYVGAGSTITEDVPPGALALSRARQKNIKGWRRKKRKG